MKNQIERYKEGAVIKASNGNLYPIKSGEVHEQHGALFVFVEGGTMMVRSMIGTDGSCWWAEVIEK